MSEICTFDYSVIRVVPRVEREEFINAGVIVFCQKLKFLKAGIEIDAQRFVAFAPFLEINEVQKFLHTIPLICSGDKAAGAVGRLPIRARFDWLVAPRSTIIQMSPVHSGICENPETALQQLLEKMVRLPKKT
ncbi:MAG TPA: DUF3037 domain-containing protein [Pyrinomonadaceae bacterium]|jgi:hypothetical protein